GARPAALSVRNAWPRGETRWPPPTGFRPHSRSIRSALHLGYWARPSAYGQRAIAMKTEGCPHDCSHDRRQGATRPGGPSAPGLEGPLRPADDWREWLLIGAAPVVAGRAGRDHLDGDLGIGRGHRSLSDESRA